MDADREAISLLILEAKERHHLSVRALAARAGVSPAVIDKAINKRSTLSPESIRKLAPVLGVSVDRLQELAGIRRPSGARQVSRDELLEQARALDAIEVEYYEMTEASASSIRRLMNGDPAGYRFLPDRGRFAKGRVKVLRVWGNCMEPYIRDGEDIYIDTRAEIEPGKVVLAVVEGDSLVVKRLRAAGNGWELAPENGEAPISLASEDHILGEVIGVWRRLL